MKTILSGSKTHHNIISDKCREIHGDYGAFKEAIDQMETAYNKICDGFGKESGVKIHIVMLIERKQETI